MRIPSGKTDQKIFFVAVDATDLVTRETGLSGFTVYRSRNGGTATVYTTPTVAELSSSNMPGVYALTIDEDTTIGSSSDSEEYCVHITCTGMAPVTRTIELYRRDTTSGRALAVDANGRVDVSAVLGTAQTAGDLAAMITAVDDYVDTEVAAIKNKTDNLPSDPADASVIAARFDTIDGNIATLASYVDTEVAAIKNKTDNLPTDPADASDIAASFVTVNGKLDTLGGYVDTEIAAIKERTDNLPDNPAASSDIPSANANADALLDRTNGIETGYTLRQTMRIMSAVLGGKSSGHPGSPVYRNLPDTADRVAASVSSGNRSDVTLTP